MAMLVKWILLLLGLIAECVGDAVIEKPTTDNFDIEFDNKVVCKVDRKFVSVAFSAGQLNKTDHAYVESSTKLRNLLKGLSPCYVRIGGTRANFIEFEPRSEKKESEDGENSESSHLESCSYSSQPDDGSSLEEDKKNENEGEGRGKRRRMKMKMKMKMKRDKKNKEDTGDTGDDKDTDDNEDPGDSDFEVPEEVASEEQSGTDGEKSLTKENEKKARKEREREHREKKAKKFAGYRNYKLTADQFDDLYKLINGTGNTMLFDINAFARISSTNNSWDSRNAEKLIQYAEMKGYTVDWQFGNEPNHYHKFKKCEQSGEEVGNDYVTFKKLVDSIMPKAKIVGPDITQPKEGKKGKKVRAWLEGFLKTGGDTIDALTWHHYYVNGREATEDDFVNATILDTFDGKNKQMKDIAGKYKFTKPIWLTESGTAWGGGAENLSDRFAGMFLYVDKFGVAARNCMQVIARQAFLDGKYAMINKTNYNPHPEYYAAALFKKYGKNDVLNVTTNKKDTNFRAYARCARKSKDGAIFLYILNLSKDPKTFAFPAYKSVKVKQFLFTAESMQSDVVLLNGEPLKMDGDELPQMNGVEDAKQPVEIPGRSIGYYIVNTDSLDICKKSSE